MPITGCTKQLFDACHMKAHARWAWCFQGIQLIAVSIWCEGLPGLGILVWAHPGYIGAFLLEISMAKGMQLNNKMVKKPKKDNSLPPLVNSSPETMRPIAPVTSVLPKGKLKNK